MNGMAGLEEAVVELRMVEQEEAMAVMARIQMALEDMGRVQRHVSLETRLGICMQEVAEPDMPVTEIRSTEEMEVAAMETWRVL